MSYRVLISEKAALDIDQTISYIAEELASPGAAERLLGRFEASIASLSENPLRCRKLMDVDSKTIYQLLVQNYSLLFTVSRQEASVTILRVLYSASDLAAKLSE